VGATKHAEQVKYPMTKQYDSQPQNYILLLQNYDDKVRRNDRLTLNLLIQKLPLRIKIIDKRFFFRTSPTFDFFLSFNGIIDILVVFPINEKIAVVFCRKAICTLSVFFQSPHQIIRNACVQYCLFEISQNVNVVLVVFHGIFFFVIPTFLCHPDDRRGLNPLPTTLTRPLLRRGDKESRW
jgi:hypothetical protein